MHDTFLYLLSPEEEYYAFNVPMIGEYFVAEGRTISGTPIVPLKDVYDILMACYVLK